MNYSSPNDSLSSPQSPQPFQPKHVTSSTPTRPNKPSQPKPPQKNKEISLVVINFQSIKNKIEELGVLLDSINPDIVLGTETWLNKNIRDSEIFPHFYNVFRNDRKDGYGGVLIAVRNNISCSRVAPQFDKA